MTVCAVLILDIVQKIWYQPCYIHLKDERRPSHYDSLLLRGVARWILRHERRWCAVSRRRSYHLPFGLLVLDDLMVEGGEDKELLDLFTKHSHHQNITVLYLCQDMFPPGKYAKNISRNAHYVIAFKNPRDQLGMRNLLLQAFPTCWQDMMDVYQKVTERPFGYTVLDLHPASDERKRVFSHLLTHEGYPRWHQRIRKEDV